MIRFYSHFAADPYFNMAFDEWMFGRALIEPDSWQLRLYTWDQPAITFGFNQNYDRAFDHSKVGDLPVIRRVTGGRALLHDPSELTYSLATNIGGGAGTADPARSAELSTDIALSLVAFLEDIGVECQCVRRSRATNSHPDFFHKAPCFASVARYEIRRGRQKIVASAQRRLEGAVFQHGSIKVGGLSSHPAVSLSASDSATVEDITALDESSFRHMEQRFMGAFAKKLGRQVVARELETEDQKGVSERVRLVQKNYSHRRDIFKQN